MNTLLVSSVFLIAFAQAHADQLCESYDCDSATSATSSSGSSGSSASGASNGSGSTSASSSTSTTSATVATAPAITVNISTVQTPSSASWLNAVASQSSDDCGTSQSNFAGDPLLSSGTYCSANNGTTEPTLYNSATNSFTSASAGKDITFGGTASSGSTTSGSSTSSR